MRYENFYRFLGLAAKAGKVAYGAQACRDAIRSGRAKLVVVDGSASENTVHDIKSSCSYHRVELIVLEEKGVLTEYLGKKQNKLIGILDSGFAHSAMEKYGSGGEPIE